MNKLKLCLKQFKSKFYFKELIGIIIAFLIFLGCMLAVVLKDEIKIDLAITNFIYQIRGEKGGFIYWLFRIITEFGYIYVIVILFLVFAIYTKLDLRCLILGAGTLITALTNEVIKYAFLRERPDVNMQWAHETSTSFPSGHSMTSMFFYVVMAYFMVNSFRLSKKLKNITPYIAASIIFLIGLSRIVLGMHYFVDVIGGYAFGFLLAMLAIIIYKILNKKGFNFLARLFTKKDSPTSGE